MTVKATDVLVVGRGNASLCAAMSAREQGCRVLVLDRGGRHELGGNSRFSGGKFRAAYADHDEVRRIIPDLTDKEANEVFDPPYTEAQFFEDMARVSCYRSDPDLLEVLVKESTATLLWSAGTASASSRGRVGTGSPSRCPTAGKGSWRASLLQHRTSGSRFRTTRER